MDGEAQVKKRGFRKGGPRSCSHLAATEPGKSLSSGPETCDNNVSQRAELKPKQNKKQTMGTAFVGGPGCHSSEQSQGRAGAQGDLLPPEGMLIYLGSKCDAEKHHAGGLSEKQ